MIRKIKKIRVFAYCAPPRPKFKIWFSIKIILAEARGHRKKERREAREYNESNMLQIAEDEANRLNKLYHYIGSERMATLIVNKIHIKI